MGKVPDPKSQVEQITIALIYKFMDDIDAESEELGGQRQFFAGEFARYGWPRLVRAGLGGHEVLNLYAEAISRMPENPGIPALFRDIFNNAYLPYRDPETLRAFLKVIDTFTYDHSERLGDAFEYLLSVLGSQGDAGQFRTPRHIIDFMVAILDPKKDETVLDPACGTAGFLVSSYKHILEANTDAEGHSILTPDEKGKLAANFKGYDISPDMVRLSLVNLYLHGFVEPHIAEYDTLTSEERWNEYADVILANPPFMSPKGGIRPHRRFSVQSKRSEVLFVDYMSEHLTPTGRAGIIVPEGVIFQSQTAYKQLRKILVENYLVAVISLPAGVFQPYSGVKTSILILDKVLAKKADRIAFFKMENDGFDLGAQRREITENDLPKVQAEIADYLGRLRASESVSADRVAESGARDGTDESAMTHGLIAQKGKVAGNGEYNLNGERYRESRVELHNFPSVNIGEVAFFQEGPGIRSYEYEEGGYPIINVRCVRNGHIDLSDSRAVKPKLVNEKWSHFRVKAGDILFTTSGTIGRVAVVKTENLPLLMNTSVVRFCTLDPNRLSNAFLYQCLRSKRFVDGLKLQATGSAQLNCGPSHIRLMGIPLPALEVQREIVAEIEGYQRVVDGARAVTDNYRPQIVVDPEWPMIELEKVCKRLQYGLSVQLNTERRGYKTFRMNELVEGKCADRGDMKCADIAVEESDKYRLARGDILFNRTNSFEHVGRTGIFDLEGIYCFASYLIRLSISEDYANPFYVNAFMNTERFQDGIKQYASRAIGQANINAKSLAAYPIPLPPISTQNQIVVELETEQALVNANHALIERFEKKVQATIARVWGEDRGQGSASKPNVGNEQSRMSERPSR